MRQTGTYNAVSMNYDSFWNCIGGWSGINNDYSEFKVIASVLTVVLLGGLLLWTMKSEFKMDLYKLVSLLHISVYTCILFLPTMHERYSYIYEISAMMLIFLNKKFFFYGVGILMLSCMAYGHYLFGLDYPSLTMSLINVALYCCYVYKFTIENNN